MAFKTFHVWMVLYREIEAEPFKPWTGSMLRPEAHFTKADAVADLYAAQQTYGKRNAYVQKVGAIS